MSANSFTPGPWEATPHGDILPEGANYLVASCGGKSGTYRNYEANARFIAASPDLYDACVMACGLIKLQRDLIERGAHAKAWNPAVEMLEAAIRKATGEPA